MTFVLDRTRSFLKIEEPNLLSLHRATHPIVPSAEYCRGHSCDAFICVVNEYNLHRVYLSLHDLQMKSNLVFTSDPVRPDDEKIAALVSEARSFLENIGFAMDQVPLNFSTATREVIIKDVRVMREPSPALQLDAAKEALAALSAEKEDIAIKAAREQVELAEKVADLQKRLDEATAARQAAPSSAGSRADEESRELRAAQQELQQVREELGAVKMTLKSTMESLKHAREEARQARKEQKQHRYENEALQEQLKAGRMELFDLKAELERVTGELAGTGVTYSGEIEILRAALAEAHASLSAEKAKNESALLEMDALERNASGELKVLKKKVDTLTAEKRLLENIAAEIKNRARGEIERQQQINRSQRAAAMQKLEALQEEIRQLAEARAVIASPAGVPLVPPENLPHPIPAANGIDLQSSGRDSSFAAEPFGPSGADKSCMFLPDTSLSGIPYLNASDVVEVYRSYNTIQAAPAGKKAQRCDGFVCQVTEGEQLLVYVAWMMNASGEVLVCRPDQAADSAESCRSIMREGIGYFERIGFMIDRLALEADPDRRRVQLDGLGVFRCSITECAA